MKALILAGGRGKRLGKEADGRSKCMLAVNGKALIEYSLDSAAKTDISEIVIVVGHRAEEIINAYGISYKGKAIRYVIQPEQKGLVHAIECAQTALDNDDFMLMLGDELMLNPRHQGMIDLFENQNAFGVCGVVVVEDTNLIKRTYSIIQSEDNRIFRLIEKPSNPMNNIMGTGNCIFRKEVLSYIPQTPINQKRVEKELPDLIQCAVDDGKVVRSFEICDHYVNVNIAEEIKRAESYFMHL